MAADSNVLVAGDELASDLRRGTSPLVIDTRRADLFARGQIAGAVHLDLWGVSLIDTSEAPLRAFTWMVGHLFSQRGVTAERPVVVYEGVSGMRAARVFWLLEYLGHRNVRVLDGGLEAWTRRGFDVSTDPVEPVPSTWHGEAEPSCLATWHDVRSRLGRPDTVIVDTRSEDEYRGRLVRARRAGAIPGARHVEWTRNLTPRGGTRIRRTCAGCTKPKA